MLDAYQLYMRDIKEIKPLDQEAENKYFKAWKECGLEKARTKIYISNLRFVVKIAHKYTNLGIPILELINEGNIGLAESMDRFNYTRGIKFISYSVWYIRQAMLSHIAKHSRFLKITGTEANFKQQLNEVSRKLSQILKREATEMELVEHSGFSLEKVRHMERVLRSNAINSMDSKGKDNYSLSDIIPDTKFNKPDDIDDKTEIILKFLKRAKLTKKQINVLTSYYGIGTKTRRNLSEISDDYSHTRERMRQIKDEALKILKSFDDKSKVFGHNSILEEIAIH